MIINWNPDELALSDIGPLKASGFWGELADRLVPAVEANKVTGITADQAKALESVLRNQDGLDILMQFSGMAGLVGQKKGEETTENLSQQLPGKNISEAQAAAEAWLKLLSHDARNLYTVLLHSRLAHEAIPSDIWRMANELMLKDEIEFQISDIEENNKTLVDQVQASYEGFIQAEMIQCDEDGRMYQVEVKEGMKLDDFLKHPRVKPPLITVESEEEAKKVLEYIDDQKGQCEIPRIYCGTPELRGSINALLDVIRTNPGNVDMIKAFLNPEGSTVHAPILQPKPPV